jgi:hypothetical protein
MSDKDKKTAPAAETSKDACCSTDAQKDAKSAEKGKKHCCCCGK